VKPTERATKDPRYSWRIAHIADDKLTVRAVCRCPCCCASGCRPSVPANTPVVFDVQLLYIPGEVASQGRYCTHVSAPLICQHIRGSVGVTA
jgi:hypothetical protein